MFPLPVFSPPLQDINVTATSGDGAVVTYSPTATAGGVDTPVSCTPASGSLFPVGNTYVKCRAGATTGRFQVLGCWVMRRRGVSALQPSESAYSKDNHRTPHSPLTPATPPTAAGHRWLLADATN